MAKSLQKEDKNQASLLKDELTKIICSRIDKLRPKLLDMTRRNPLISTKFSDRSNSLVRIVDEVPELLLADISTGSMRIVSLPDLGITPKDEDTREFQNALAEARINNEDYINRLDAINQESDEATGLLVREERRLKDQLREKLGMPPRQTKNNLSLQQHAKNNGISPHYELPFKNEQHEDGRHTDKDIQTLLLPDVMERRLNALHGKEKTWKEETGISVLHAAFGFLEWEDGNNSKSQFSPLILTPVQLEKKRTSGGQEFWVSSDDAEPEENKILAEKLRLEFNITLPEYTGQGIEKYLKEIEEQKPPNMMWKVRRWATIGVFPSARLAMYHDLAPGGWDFASHSIISSLFGGTDTGHDALPFGDEYNIDEPDIESKVPYLIADADSSQFSTIVDVVDGKNLAVEGPPGTGKSQTIVNTIAAALALGKKVLFVAEKSAALEVVKARLEAFGIGDFVLPLQANRSTKQEVISSIRSRIKMRPSKGPVELNQELKNFRGARKKLKQYLDTISTNFGETDFTIHDILGGSIKSLDVVDALSDDIKAFSIPNITKLSSDKLQDIIFQCKQIEEALEATLTHPDFWKIIKSPNIDPFKAQEVLKQTANAEELFLTSARARNQLQDYKLNSEIVLKTLHAIEEIIDNTNTNLSKSDIDTAEKMNSSALINEVRLYLGCVSSWQKSNKRIGEHIVASLDKKTFNELILIKDICTKHGFESLSSEDLGNALVKNTVSLQDVKEIVRFFEQAVEVSDILLPLLASDLTKVINKLSSTSRQTLSLRSKDLDDPSFQLIFIKQITKARDLKEQRERLGKTFSLSGLPSSFEIIANHAAEIAQAGVFGFISRDYRKARRFYKSIDKTKTFKKNLAAEELRELSEWVASIKNFSENEAIKKILGIHDDGIDTDFTPFEKVIELFSYTDESFTGANYSALREFIKYGDIEQIQSLPKLEEGHPIHSSPDLDLQEAAKKLNLIEKQISECESDVKELQELKIIFKIPEDVATTLIKELLSQLDELLQTQQDLQRNNTVKNMLGDSFKAEETNEDELQDSIKLALNLISLDHSERDALLDCMREDLLTDLKKLIMDISQNDTSAHHAVEKIASLTGTKPEDWIQNKTVEEISKFMQQASVDKDGLISYSRLVALKNTLAEDGYSSFIEAMLANKQYNLCEAIEALIMRGMARAAYATYGEILVSYNGSKLSLLRKRLQESDRKVIQLSRQSLQAQLFHSARPPAGNGVGKKSTYSEMALLRHQTSLQRPSGSVRSLTQKAAKALLEIKPCWMMSPLAVAQYLPKGGIEFDLLIVDEASQMTPEDAIGALVRTKQAMIVGDTNQLPPMNLFRRLFDDDNADEDEKVTEESILEMANACFNPARRLRWHYRSRHSSLIAFSNKHVYNDDLVVFPSAYENDPEMGVSYVKVNGTYSSGTNPEEAKVMVDAILDFMRKWPNKSLGVVLLNQKQRDLLTDEMNYSLENNKHAIDYKERWEHENDGLESFFIKNLENVQGDERDVIFIGTVYGPETEGTRVMQRFKACNGRDGKRRLNVLFSRAKERIVTFSSMTSSDIQAEEDGNPGVYMLSKWLEYSASGVLQSGEVSEKEPDSAFEEHVIQQIKSIGCEAIPQVGVKGYSIDIGVKHPDWPHGFIMGVECDGAAYHSSVSARDRDRLRQDVLEGLGWNLYRIWSTDWFEDPRRETEKLRQVILDRLSELKSM